MNNIAKYLIVAGALIMLAGVIFYFFPNAFKWLGKLPGDIRIEKENSRFYFPIVTMIIVSIVATLLFNLFKRFL